MKYKNINSYCVLFIFIGLISHAYSEMSLEEKVGQLLMVHFHGEEAHQEAKTLIQDLHVGGVIYYNWCNGLVSASQISHLSTGLQKLAKTPLFIAVDQEGGLVNRLKQGFTLFPGNLALAKTRQPELAEESAFAIGQELLSVGINMNLAPVVDINNNPYNPIIGIRSFASSADQVILFAKHALEGFHRAGMITCLKHFPGHGDVMVDSHQGLPIIKKTKEQLDKLELLPFYQLAGQADSIMTAHLLLPALDSKNCATLSKNILTNLLREEMGFQGVIISDSLVMQGFLNNGYSIEEAAIRSINAGCDLLILGGKQLNAHSSLELNREKIQNIHQALLQAVQTGIIAQKRLEEALERILTLKSRIVPFPLVKYNGQEHQKLSEKIASLALHVLENKPISLKKEVVLLAPKILKTDIEQTRFSQITNHCLFFNLNPSQDEYEKAQELVQKASSFVCFCYDAWKNPQQITLIQSLLKTKKPLVLLSVKDPIDAHVFIDADVLITTFSPTVASIKAAYEKIQDQLDNLN
ncbi:MAG: beta-N-acetylhexosaminidase [Chlamydiales bacterium]|jgi:beta-N-acetylhexosaminidase|nr:beta-N-acetylhexosaminidase [Chlamydiales bacterium]